MAQVSRPYQIGLAAVAVLALVWFVALRGHGASSSEPSAPGAPSKPSASAAHGTGAANGSSAAAQERAAGAPSKVYHGAAPGVEGLTRDIAKAHGAVATSQRSAAELRQKSSQASGEASGPGAAAIGGVSAAASGAAGTTSGPTHRAGAAGTASGSAHGTGVAKTRAAQRGATRQTGAAHKGGGSHAAGAGSSARPAQQAQVERELTHGKTVVLVFWDPKSSVDATVRSQALALAGSSKGRVAVHVARANQVGLFGPVTEVAHVYQTPTVLIVSKHGLVTTLTGLTDTFALQQAVREAERANH
jgi:hypothetical protein